MVGHLLYAGFDEEECDFMKQKKVAWKKTAMFVVFVLCVGFFVSPTAHAYTFYIGDYYYLVSALDESMVVDVSGGSKNDEANIQLYEKNGTDAQLFRIARSSDGYYEIINKGSNKAIDVSGGGSDDCTNVWQYHQNGTSAQQWMLYNAVGYSDGYISIMNRCGKYLDVSGGNKDNGANIQIYTYNGTAAQVFKMVPYVQTSTKTIALGSFSTPDEWATQMQIAEREAAGLPIFRTNISGETTNYGYLIMDKTILEYKTIPVTYSKYGTMVTEQWQLPSKVQFKLHKHEIDQLVWFDFTNLTLTQYCSCGYRCQLEWEVPYPIEDTVSK